MKKILIIISLLLSARNSFGQTQLKMNETAQKKYLKVDQELNTIYQSILKTYKEDTTFIRCLKASQKIWITFRDSEMQMRYPHTYEQFYYGSVLPMCWSMSLTELSNDRIKTLKVWMEGIVEGDVCSGSIRIKP